MKGKLLPYLILSSSKYVAACALCGNTNKVIETTGHFLGENGYRFPRQAQMLMLPLMTH